VLVAITFTPVPFGFEACVTPLFELCKEHPACRTILGSSRGFECPTGARMCSRLYFSQREKVIVEGKLFACKAVPLHGSFHPTRSKERAAEGKMCEHLCVATEISFDPQWWERKWSNNPGQFNRVWVKYGCFCKLVSVQ